ncbi:transcription factor with AP2 domain, putative [Babesia caballi]|uniref:Transcription factor with AP2 domain, putative n=1 Tax=Babesia caballi TaxID=5871 RepID=A0AAV4LW86_BABCB|nr:transcription factor with AP2 domain, putative [Babesia caballi]
MDGRKPPMKPGVPGHGMVHAPGGFGYDSQYMKHVPNPVARRSPDLSMPLPRYPSSGALPMKNEPGVFDSLASHPGLRVQIPSHDQLTNKGGGPLEEASPPNMMMHPDHESAARVKAQRAMSQMRYQPPINYNMVNYGMVPQHRRMAEVPPSQMMRYPPHNDGMGHVYPKVDPDVGNMAAAITMTQIAQQQHLPQPPPLVKPQIPPSSSHAQTMMKYHHMLQLKEEPAPVVQHHECSGGVVFDKGPFSQGGRWLVFWEYRGRMWRKSFLATMYGDDGAKELAEQFWLSKMRALQLYSLHRMADLPPDAEVKRVSEPRRAVKQKRRTAAASAPPSEPLSEADRSNEPAPIGDDPEVFWDAATNSWCFEFLDMANNQVVLKQYPVPSPAMMMEVKKEAMRHRAEHWRAVVRAYVESEYCGHTYEKYRTCWRVSHWIPSKGINRNRYFNISKYGYIEAKEKSKLYRLLVHDLGGEEPESFPTEVSLPPEFFEDPVTKFYHRVLYSLRGKDKS